jgi:hypothetical protein
MAISTACPGQKKKVPPKRKRPGIRLPAAYRPFGLSCCELPHPNLGLNHENRKPNAALVWKQNEDLLAPRLHFSRTDRTVYSHLFRHSRLEGRTKFRFSIAWLARGVGLSMKATRESVRSLVARGVVDLIERNRRTQHVIWLRLPLEVKPVLAKPTGPPEPTKVAINIEEEGFLLKQSLRCALHDRDGGNCFYCMRRTRERNWCLDHVVPQAPRRQQFLPQSGVVLRGVQLE